MSKREMQLYMEGGDAPKTPQTSLTSSRASPGASPPFLGKGCLFFTGRLGDVASPLSSCHPVPPNSSLPPGPIHSALAEGGDQVGSKHGAFPRLPPWGAPGAPAAPVRRCREPGCCLAPRGWPNWVEGSRHVGITGAAVKHRGKGGRWRLKVTVRTLPTGEPDAEAARQIWVLPRWPRRAGRASTLSGGPGTSTAGFGRSRTSFALRNPRRRGGRLGASASRPHLPFLGEQRQNMGCTGGPSPGTESASSPLGCH